MSRRRYISTDISTDIKLAELAEHGVLPLLLFTWAVPHMDDWGRMTGDARQFKLLVCPALDVSTKEVDEALTRIADVDLWIRYEVDGKRYITIPEDRWFRHQSYINKAKRTDDSGSNIPKPIETPLDDDPFGVDYRKTPQITEERREVAQNTVSFSPSPSPSLSNTSSSSRIMGNGPFAIYQRQFGNLDEITTGIIADLMSTYTDDWTSKAMVEAVKHGKKSLSYVEAILKRWKALNVDKPWEVEKQELPKQQQGYQRRQGQPSRPLLKVAKAPDAPEASQEDIARMMEMAQRLTGG